MSHFRFAKLIEKSVKKYFFLTLVMSTLFSCKDKNENTAPVEPKPSVSISPKAATYDVGVLNDWNELHLKLLENNPSIPGPVAARSIGYVNLAAYESIIRGTTNVSMVGQLSGLDKLPASKDSLEYNWGLVANVAQYTLLKEMFLKASVADNAAIDNLLSTYERQFRANVDQAIIKRSIEYGAAMATAVWEYAKKDGGHIADSLYFPRGFVYAVGLGAWKTSPLNARPLLPQWKQLRPFYAANKFLSPSGIIPFSYRSESEFFRDALEVYNASKDVTAAARANTTYWKGNGNGNLSVVRPLQVFNKTLKQQQLKLDEAVRINLKAGIAVNDAAIAVWRIKFDQNLLRPTTYIHETLDKNWQSIVPTPATPSFPSFSGTIAGAISNLISTDLGGRIASPFNQTTLTAAEFKKEVVNAEVRSGTNFRMSGERGFELGERLFTTTDMLRFK